MYGRILEHLGFLIIVVVPIYSLIPCPKGIKQFAAYPDKDVSDPSYFYDCSSTTSNFAELKRCPSNEIFDSKTEICSPRQEGNKHHVFGKRLKRSEQVQDDVSGLEESKREPTLGRAIQLGSLYYGKDDRISINENLWGASSLKKNAVILKTPSSKTKLAITQTTKERVKLFGMGLNLRVTALFGIVIVNGNAKYLSEKRTKSNTGTVTFSYEAITSSESISQDLRSNLDFPDICLDIIGRENAPTHVVTSVTR